MNRNDVEIARRAAQTMYDNDAASQALGMTFEVPAAGTALTRMTVTDDMLNGFGICHGGFVFSLADSAFAFACNASGRTTVAAGASIEWLLPAKGGDRLEARAELLHRSGRTGWYDVRVSNQDGALLALFRGRATEPRNTGSPTGSK